jgi:hypothetical protein
MKKQVAGIAVARVNPRSHWRSGEKKIGALEKNTKRV